MFYTIHTNESKKEVYDIRKRMIGLWNFNLKIISISRKFTFYITDKAIINYFAFKLIRLKL